MSPKFRSLIPIALSCLLCLTACEKPEQKEARYIKRGNELFDAGDFAKARLEYKNAEQIMPTAAEPRYRLGLVDEAQGDPRNAFANYLSAEQQNAHFHPALLKIAQYFIALGQYEEADHRLNLVLTETPDDAEGHALRGAILLRRKEYDGAEKEARIALAADPTDVSATAVLTGLYSAQKNGPKAAAAVDEGISHSPKDLSLRLLKVMLYEQSSNLEQTASAYQDVFTLKPDAEIYRADLAKIYVKAGKLDAAEATLRTGVAAMPDDWAMKRDLVVFLGENRSLDIAEKEIRQLMLQYPKNDSLYFWLADLYISHQATDRAIALLEEIIAREKFDNFALSARTDLAHIQFLKGDRELARKLVTAVLDKDPGNQDAMLIRAQMAYDEGRYKDAVSDLRAIIRDNAHAENAIELLAETLLLQGYPDLAIDTMNQLIEVNPANLGAHVRLAQMYSLSGNSSRAMDILAVVTKANPSFAVAWESTARIALLTKDYKTAQAAIDKLQTLPDQRALATYLQAQLLQNNGKPEAALPLYVQVFSADPTSPLSEHALSAFVGLRQHVGQLADAAAVLQSLKPETSFIDTLIGGCFTALGKDDTAASYYDKAIAAKSSSQDTYVARAQIYIKSKQLPEALKVLELGRNRAPADIRASTLAAAIYQKSGQAANAIALYDGVLASHPGADAVANELAETIADYQYNDPAALEKARQVAERFSRSDNPLYLDTLGWVYFRQGQLQQAQTIFERAASYNKPLPAEAHYHKASLLLKLGQLPQAKAELQLATPAGANYPGIDDARQALRNL